MKRDASSLVLAPFKKFSKMRVLIIGYSKIVQKRVLPALVQIPVIESVDVASQTSASKISLPEKTQRRRKSISKGSKEQEEPAAQLGGKRNGK